MGMTLSQLIEAFPAEISKIGAPGLNDFISVQLLEGFLFQNGMPCREFGILGTQSFRMQHADNHKQLMQSPWDACPRSRLKGTQE